MNQTYQGSCHCGFVKFELTATLITSVRECNCSICFKRGALNVRVENDQLNILTPLNELHVYQWGRKTAKDYFCPICGILPFRRPGSLTEEEIAAGKPPFYGWAVNARCLTGLNVSSLPRVQIDGASL